MEKEFLCRDGSKSQSVEITVAFDMRVNPPRCHRGTCTSRGEMIKICDLFTEMWRRKVKFAIKFFGGRWFSSWLEVVCAYWMICSILCILLNDLGEEMRVEDMETEEKWWERGIGEETAGTNKHKPIWSGKKTKKIDPSSYLFHLAQTSHGQDSSKIIQDIALKLHTNIIKLTK